MGGLARRATAIRTMEAEKGKLLLVDSGNCLGDGGKISRLESEVMLEGMDRMGYAALNLGVFEFVHGLEFLAEWRKKVHYPFISSNLAITEGTAPLAEKYVIKEINGLKIGLLGVVSPELFNRVYLGRFAEALQLTSPQTALASLVPRLRDKVDVVILLANCGFDDVKQIVQEIRGIDLAIVSGERGAEKVWLERPSGPAVATVINQGQEVGFMEISLASPVEVRKIRFETKALDNSILADGKIQELVDNKLGHQPQDYKTARESNESFRVQAAIPEEELKQLLQLKPEEYLGKLRRDAAQRGGSR